MSRQNEPFGHKTRFKKFASFRSDGVLIVINGSIASGKSTIARGYARHLAARGIAAAVIDLDLLYDMHHQTTGVAKGDQRTWAIARRAAAALTDTFQSEGVRHVVVEGTFFTPAQRAAYLDALTTPVTPRFITLRVGYDEAIRRAEGDPTRGVSRDPRVPAPLLRPPGCRCCRGPSNRPHHRHGTADAEEAVATIVDFVADSA